MTKDTPPLQPLDDAIEHLNKAGIIAYEYMLDEQYTPDQPAMKLFDKLEQAFVRNQMIVKDVMREMGKRYKK